MAVDEEGDAVAKGEEARGGMTGTDVACGADVRAGTALQQCPNAFRSRPRRAAVGLGAP